MIIKLIPNDRSNPPGKLADAEIHFTSGPLEGLKLIGFGIWERRSGGRTVTFPARQYSVNGERRSFALLRPIANDKGQQRLTALILETWDQYQEMPTHADQTPTTTDTTTTTTTDTPETKTATDSLF